MLKKQEDGLRLGVGGYHATSDPDTFEQLAGRFALIVNTVSAGIDLNAYPASSPSTALWST